MRSGIKFREIRLLRYSIPEKRRVEQAVFAPPAKAIRQIVTALRPFARDPEHGRSPETGTEVTPHWSRAQKIEPCFVQ
jgi:hypothetical protein